MMYVLVDYVFLLCLRLVVVLSTTKESNQGLVSACEDEHVICTFRLLDKQAVLLSPVLSVVRARFSRSYSFGATQCQKK
jgi:hypothetical protein